MVIHGGLIHPRARLPAERPVRRGCSMFNALSVSLYKEQIFVSFVCRSDGCFNATRPKWQHHRHATHLDGPLSRPADGSFTIPDELYTTVCCVLEH